MSGYQGRIQGTDRLLRIRRMRNAVYLGLLVLTALLMYARVIGEGASLKPFFLPLDGVVEIALIMGLVGTILGLFFKNLEIQRAQTDSQRYLMSKYSMSRALTTAVVAVAFGVLLVLPIAASGASAVLTPSTPPVNLSQAASQTAVNYTFSSPDSLGASAVTGVHVQPISGNVNITLYRNGRLVLSRSVGGSSAIDLPLPSGVGSVPSNWTLGFRLPTGVPSASLTFTLPVAVMPSLFSTVPFLLFLYFAADLGWWFGLRPIRDRTKSAALYAGTDQAMQIDSGERAYVEYATQAPPISPATVSQTPIPPPPPSPLPPPPVPVVAAPAVATAPATPAPRVEPRPAPQIDTAQTFTSKGNTLISIQQYPSAIASYDEALRLNPAYLPAFMGKANAYLGMKQDAGALDAYRHVLAVEPGNEEALRGSAKVLATQARWRESLEAVEVFLRQRPNDTWALELKGDVLTNLGRRPEALAAYEAAQALDPKNENVRQKIEEVRVDVPGLLSRALIGSASGNYSQALNLFDDILEVEPGNVNALIGKAVAYRRSGKTQEALNCLDLVLNIQPNNASALLNRGNMLVEKGDLEAALESFDRLVSISPLDEEAWAAQAEVFTRMGRDDDALRAYAEALRLNPGDADVQRKIQDLEISRSIHADVLQDLYKVKGIGPARAKSLVDAGFRTAEDFRQATAEQLLAVKGITHKIADDLVKHFKEVTLVEAH